MQGVLKGSIFLSENDMIRRNWIFHYFLYLSKSENQAYNITLGLLETHHFFFLLFVLFPEKLLQPATTSLARSARFAASSTNENISLSRNYFSASTSLIGPHNGIVNAFQPKASASTMSCHHPTTSFSSIIVLLLHNRHWIATT